MSSSSSSYSDEDTEASAPGVASPPSASQLFQAVELAQICSFCSTFRKPLRLPSFSRSELQEALLGASNGEMAHVELLAELHFKLAREHPTAKMEKMVQDWEKTLLRKLQDNWRKEFTANPMGGGVSYRDLTVFERMKILDALCHWKLDTCGEIHKHIAMLQKENDNDGIMKLRAGEIGTNDNGVSYWYFDDGCWIYAEDKPRWQREERKPSYLVEFANAKRIRLSINFDPDHNSSAPPIRLPVKMIEAPEDVKEQNKVKTEVHSEAVKQESKDEAAAPEPSQAEEAGVVKGEKQEVVASDEASTGVKEEASASTAAVAIKMDIAMLCAAGSPSAGVEMGEFAQQPVASSQTNGTAQMTDVAIAITHTSSLTNVVEASSNAPDKSDTEGTATSKEYTSTDVNEDNAGEHNHESVVAIVGSKKRTIIDDDSSDCSSDADAKKAASSKVEGHETSSPPPRKKRKASAEHTNSETGANPELHKNSVMKSDNTQGNETTTPQMSNADIPVVTEVKETNPASKPEVENERSLTGSQDSKVAVVKTVDTTNPLVPAATSPTDPAAAPESFDITCESCKKSYDMRYVDPPLMERPTDEWRCFECLVNDARGWPRRRKSTPMEPFSPRADGRPSKKRSSSSKARSGLTTSKKTSSKSSSSKKKSSQSSSSKRKSSSNKSSSRKKSSSSSKKHKKRKSSSSSHHRSSSHSHHRRRHHSHYHHEEFAKLVGLFRERQEQRLGVEEARIKGDLQVALDESPQGWRVMSSTMDGLRALIQTLSGGSLEQDRLRGRLIVILKIQEKLEEQMRKQQELAWNILPRRQASRIAIGRMRQSAQDSDVDEGMFDDDVDSRRPGLRSSRSHSTPSDGFDDKQKLAYDRASRARRRHLVSDDEMDMDNEEDEVDGNASAPGNWIDWSLLEGNSRRLSTVCLALVNRLLKEEAADLFSRPVNPALDGCPNYLSVINRPMDLGTIRSRLEASSYRKWEIFKKDVELVWQNCCTFNAPDTMVVQFADLLSKLSRSMCIAAEKKGVVHMKDITNSDDADNHGSPAEDGSTSDASKAESHSSINKAWSASASESSESSDGDMSSGGDSDGGRKRRSTRTASKKPPTRSRSTRSSRPAKPRPSRSTRSRSSKKRPAPTSSSEDESSASEDNEVFSPVRKSRRQPRGSVSKVSGKADPATEDDSSGDERANNRPPPPQNGALSPSPPPPQAVQKRSKLRLVISESSSSDDSSDSNSSSSSSSDSDDSDSDAPPAANTTPQPPPPSSAEVPAPPPLCPPPPAASPVDSKPRSSPKVNSKPKTAANHGRKAKTPSAAKTDAGGSGYAHSTPLLNTYLSPSSSSSSDFSSDDSDSRDGDSDSD